MERLRKKVEYRSALAIQRWMKKYTRLRRQRGANILLNFVRSIIARQAVTVASWAAEVIRKFAVHVSAAASAKGLV